LLLLLITFLIDSQMQTNNDKWLVVVNVFAASKKAGSVWKSAAVMLEKAGVSYKAMFTGGVDNAIAISRKSAAKGYRKFLAVGGDGTVHDVLNGIADYVYSSDAEGVSVSDFTLGVLPVGSGNDWVKSTGVPKDLEQAVKIIAQGHTMPQDVVRASVLDYSGPASDLAAASQADVIGVSYMVNVGGVGIDARVCEIVNKKKERGLRGKKLYVQALLYCIMHRTTSRAVVYCDGEELFSGDYYSMAFGVGKYSGGGMRQTPGAELGDGLLDVTVIPQVSVWTIIKAAPRLFTDTFHKGAVPQLETTQCRSVFVLPETGSDVEPVEVDGEVVGRAPVRMDVMPESINVITPGRR
jgi:YegS/Rv2252/BmrU family lipid kinase